LREKDLKRIKGRDLLDDERFEDMTKKEQRKVISFVRAVNKNFFVPGEEETETKIGSTAAFFICKYCGNSEPIKPATQIYSKSYNATDNAEVEDYTYTIYDQTLPRTRDYICKNEKCESHTNDKVKEATLTKNVNEQIVYICNACSTYWTG